MVNAEKIAQYQTISSIFFIISALLLVAAVIMFIKFDMMRVIDRIMGRGIRREREHFNKHDESKHTGYTNQFQEVSIDASSDDLSHSISEELRGSNELIQKPAQEESYIGENGETGVLKEDDVSNTEEETGILTTRAEDLTSEDETGLLVKEFDDLTSEEETGVLGKKNPSVTIDKANEVGIGKFVIVGEIVETHEED